MSLNDTNTDAIGQEHDHENTSPTDAVPDQGFVDGIEIYKRRKPTVTLAIEHTITSPTLFRNSQDDRAEMQEFPTPDGDEILRAQVNPEKFTTKERLTGLDLGRRLDETRPSTADDADDPRRLVAPEYAYNEPDKFDEALNPDTITYGLSGTGSDEFSFKSRVIAGYTYTTDPYEIGKKEVHNAVYESGTMIDEEGGHSEALFEYVKVQPGNSFVRFVTIEAGTPEMLLYVMQNILNTARYGARETRTGRNVRSEILALILGDHDTSLSTAEWLTEYHDPADDDASVSDTIGRYIDDVRRSDWSVYGDDLPDGIAPAFPAWFNRFHEVASRRSDDADDVLRKELDQLMDDAWDVFGAQDENDED